MPQKTRIPLQTAQNQTRIEKLSNFQFITFPFPKSRKLFFKMKIIFVLTKLLIVSKK